MSAAAAARPTFCFQTKHNPHAPPPESAAAVRSRTVDAPSQTSAASNAASTNGAVVPYGESGSGGAAKRSIDTATRQTAGGDPSLRKTTHASAPVAVNAATTTSFTAMMSRPKIALNASVAYTGRGPAPYWT